jgi:hypothetical protein
MTIVKITLHKMNAERNLGVKGGQVKINNNVSITNLEEMDFAVEGKKGLKFTFTFSCNYEPGLGKIEVEGQVLFVDTEAIATEALEEWKKSKKVPFPVMEAVINAALHKGNVQAIKISEDVSLPSPLPLPKVKPQVDGSVSSNATPKENTE